jgi:uncharacterized protein
LPIRKRTVPRSSPGSARGRGWRGVWLFTLGLLVGAVSTYVACRNGPRGAGGGFAGIRSLADVASWWSGSQTADAGTPATGTDAGTATRRRSATARGPHAGRSAAAPGHAAAAPQVTPAADGGEEPAGAARDEAAGRSGAQAAGGGAAAGVHAGGPPRIALVIDDLGRSLDEVDSLERLGVPLTYAVLPFESQTATVVAALRRHHQEILCHLPMEPRSGGNPGPGALRLGMSSEQLRQSTAAALAAVPGAVGVNNHMGSGLSTDEPAMTAVLGVLAARGLFFLDSRTSAQTVGYRVATSLGVPAAERQVFLDDDLRAAAVADQFQHLLDVALARGEAIAIGHPHPATLATLATEVPRARALGYRFVLVSALLDRPPAAPAPAAAR